MKHLKRLTFICLGLIILVLIVATVLEQLYGTNFVKKYIYHSYTFITLWTILSICTIIYFFKCKLHKRLITFMLHISFIVILIGALFTYLSGEYGKIYLKKDIDVSLFIKNGKEKNLPFNITLTDFQILYYTGTRAPMDFVSKIQIKDNNTNIDREVSMNHIFKYKNYRFYQSGYDINGNVTLSVSHDPYGITITYIGYALLLLSILTFFFDKKSHFRILLKSPLLKRGIMVIALIFAFNIVKSSEPMLNPKTLPKDIAAQFGNLNVLYNDRVCPLETLAKDFTIKLYGKPNYKSYTPEQVFTGWMFYYSSWKKQPMFKIKKKEIRKILGIKDKFASFEDFTDKYYNYKLEEIIKQIHLGKNVSNKNAFINVDEKYNLIAMLYAGKMLCIYPIADTENIIHWYSQSDNLPENLNDDEYFFVKNIQNYIYELVIKKDYKELSTVLDKIKIYQMNNARKTIPSSIEFYSEKIYNKLNYNGLIAITCMTIGILLFAYYCNRLSVNHKIDSIISTIGLIWTIIILLYLTLTIILRWIIGKHIPLSNGFETMQFMAWCVVILIILLHKRFKIILPSGILICGLAMMVSMMGESNPQITQLMPVLSSPLLSIHVSILMLSYSLLALVMLNGIAAIVIYLVGNRNNVQIERLQVISQIILYPAIFCLTIGIFIGAVWANISWGHYWSWDPKEVWALITLLFYSFALHSNLISVFRKPLFFHIFTVIAFFFVLFTYFGVNFLLGGMHAYV